MSKETGSQTDFPGARHLITFGLVASKERPSALWTEAPEPPTAAVSDMCEAETLLDIT